MVNYIGYGSKILKGYNLNLGDNILLPDILLSSTKKNLDEVVAKGFTYMSSRERIGVATKISGDALNRIPTSSRNYQDLAKLSPLTPGTNVAGARGNSRGFTLDGVSNIPILNMD